MSLCRVLNYAERTCNRHLSRMWLMNSAGHWKSCDNALMYRLSCSTYLLYSPPICLSSTTFPWCFLVSAVCCRWFCCNVCVCVRACVHVCVCDYRVNPLWCNVGSFVSCMKYLHLCVGGGQSERRCSEKTRRYNLEIERVYRSVAERNKV